MPDKSKRFHEFALKSILFKGRADWYYCYLKSERLAHVLAVLAARGAQGHLFGDLVHGAAALPHDIARLAAGELEPSFALADVFGLLSEVRLCATRGTLTAEQSGIIAKEYEALAERLVQGSHPSPFASADDFYVPEFPRDPLSIPLPALKDIKDTSLMSFKSKGHVSEESDRAALILSYIKEKKSLTGQGASIKDIAGVIKDCSEKTIQRELNLLIGRGLVRRIGERRWSLYVVA